MSFIQSFGPIIGRILIALIFLWSGFGKLAHPSHAAMLIASVHLPYSAAAAVVAGLLEMLAGAALVLGLRTRGVAFGLLLYLVVVTWLFHWPGQTVEVMKNLAIAGGLLGLMAHGPGKFSMNQ